MFNVGSRLGAATDAAFTFSIFFSRGFFAYAAGFPLSVVESKSVYLIRQLQAVK